MDDVVLGPPTELTDDQSQIVLIDEEYSSLDDVAFDEMNIVELPFALLTRNTNGIHEIPLSRDGRSKLVCLESSKYGLPNSTATRVLLGLQRMWMREYRKEYRTFPVKIRDLVVRHMEPERFKNYAPNSEYLRSVEQQINCIANSRIETDAWWDAKLRQHQEVNVSIISDVKVIDKGGPHRPRVLELTWGKPFWESLVNEYTKPLDMGIIQRLRRPLALQAYRLLHRQLWRKPLQSYKSIVDLGRFKFAMQGKELERGDSTASKYVTKKLSAAVLDVNKAGYEVRMTVNRKVVPFPVKFERPARAKPQRPAKAKPQPSTEAAAHDGVEELVQEFQWHAHGIPREHTRTRIAEADRAAAKEWLDAYGFEKAKWMIERAVKMQKQRKREPIHVFKGLQFYENDASGAYEQHVTEETTRRERQLSEEIDRDWNTYRTKLVELFDARTSAEERASLEAEVRENLQRERPDLSGRTIDIVLRSRLRELKCAQMKAFPESEFRAHRSLRALRVALTERHAVDLLAPSGAGSEGEDARPAA